MIATTLVLASMLVSQTPKTTVPKTDPTVVGIWVLKSAVIGGKAATTADLSGILKDYGGCEIGMDWKFKKENSASLNSLDGYYDFDAETKELVIGSLEEGKEDFQRFDVRFTGKSMSLRFKDKGKTVVLNFSPDA